MKCTICGSNSIKQVNDVFVCEICGVEYSKDEILGGEVENNNKSNNKEISCKKVLAIGLPIIAVLLITVVLFTTIIPLIRYNEAMKLISSSEFDKAYNILCDLGDYKDSKAQIIQSKYNRAIACIENKDYHNAYELLNDMEEYKDSLKLKLLAKLNIVQLNDEIIFGKYEQDDNRENGSEDIEWIVIDKKDNKLLLISKYCLYAGYYNKETTPFDETMTWEECDRREWLNKTFIESAFSQEEQDRIIKSDVKASDNEQYGTTGGKNTKDKVFFLSEQEIKKYLKKEQIKTVATPYAKKKGAKENGSCSWWTRTPGVLEWQVTSVEGDGKFFYYEAYDSLEVGIRPAIWISTSNEIETPDEESEFIGQWTGRDAFYGETVENLNLSIHKITETELLLDYTSPYISKVNVTATMDSNGAYVADLGDGITLNITVGYEKINVDECVGLGADCYTFYKVY